MPNPWEMNWQTDAQPARQNPWEMNWDDISTPSKFAGATISATPQPQGFLPSVEDWAKNAIGDIRYGTTTTGLGRALHAMGAPGTSIGQPEAVGNYMSSPIQGPLQMLQGAAETPQTGKHLQGLGDIAGGALSTAQIPLSFAGPEGTAQGVESVSPKLLASKAGDLYREVSGAAGKLPIDVTSPGNVALEFQKLKEAGGPPVKVITDFIKRATDPSKGPITYDEARLFYQNATKLSASEAMETKPAALRLLAQFTHELGGAISDTAAQAGKGDEYLQAMNTYRRSAWLKDLVASGKKLAEKSIIPAMVGAGGYGAYRELKSTGK